MSKDAAGLVAQWLMDVEKLTASLSQRVRSTSKAAQESLFAAPDELDAIGRDLDRLSELAERRTSITKSLAELYDKQLLTLEGDVRARITEEGWKIDGEWPQLVVQRGVDLVFDGSKREFAVSGHRVPALDLEQVVERLRLETKDLVPKAFVPTKFLEQLGAAYDSLRKNDASVAVASVYRELVTALQSKRFWQDARVEHFVSLTRDQFRARLTACLEAGCQQLRDGRHLRLLPPIDAKEALFLYQPAEQRFAFVGRVSFVGEREADRG